MEGCVLGNGMVEGRNKTDVAFRAGEGSTTWKSKTAHRRCPRFRSAQNRKAPSVSFRRTTATTTHATLNSRPAWKGVTPPPPLTPSQPPHGASYTAPSPLLCAYLVEAGNSIRVALGSASCTG